MKAYVSSINLNPAVQDIFLQLTVLSGLLFVSFLQNQFIFKVLSLQVWTSQIVVGVICIVFFFYVYCFFVYVITQLHGDITRSLQLR